MKKIVPLMTALAVSVTAPAYANAMHGDTKQWVDHYFTKLDTDKDGLISKDEFMEHAQKKFGDMDTSHDGELSKHEVTEYKKKEHNEMKSYHGKSSSKNTSNLPGDASEKPVTSEETKTNSERQ